jgi:hypothetical protein
LPVIIITKQPNRHTAPTSANKELGGLSSTSDCFAQGHITGINRIESTPWWRDDFCLIRVETVRCFWESDALTSLTAFI